MIKTFIKNKQKRKVL